MLDFLSIQINKSPSDSHEGDLSFSSNKNFYVIKNSKINVRLKKREAYPKTYCHVDKNVVKLGYRETAKTKNEESLRIRVTSSGSLKIERDSFATLPIFYTNTKNGLVLSNEYASVVEQTESPLLSKAGLIESLAFSIHLPRAILDGVNYLREGEMLTYSDGKLEVLWPAGRSWRRSSDTPASKPKDFLNFFSDYLNYFVDTRLRGQEIAFEVSGGLDSATLPQYFSRYYRQPIVMASLIFPSNYRQSQLEKLYEIQKTTRGEIIFSELDKNTHFPLAGLFKQHKYRPFYLENMYAPAFETLLDRLQQRGVKVISTGLGGDELFGNTADPEYWDDYGEYEKKRRQEQPLPKFLTPQFREEFVASTPAKALSALPLRPLSINHCQLANNLYIRRNIWPVSPFTDPDVFNWIQGLPAHFRANRNILRAYQQAMGFVSQIYNPVQSEGFEEFFSICFKNGNYDELIHDLIENSVTVKLGYVNPQSLISEYENAKHSDSLSDEIFYRIYLWMAAEINAQHTGIEVAA